MTEPAPIGGIALYVAQNYSTHTIPVPLSFGLAGDARSSLFASSAFRRLM